MPSVMAAVLLALWYLLAVTGIDVHKDIEHGRTYVICGLTPLDCEHIHPESHCHDFTADSEGRCLSDEDCCSDDFEALLSLCEGPDALQPDHPAPVLMLSGIFPELSGQGPLPVVREPRGRVPLPDSQIYFHRLSVLRV